MRITAKIGSFAALCIGLFFMLCQTTQAQFYRGSYQEFGKNRVQYDEFIWTSYRFPKFNMYFYTGGQKAAIYSSKTSQKILKELEEKFDYFLDDKIHFILYNKIGHFRQSNIGLSDEDPENLGGISQIAGAKVFLYYEGDHKLLENQIRAGISRIIINHMMYGDNWKEMVKNSTLLTLPDWYVTGLVSYASNNWSVEIDNRVRDGVLSGKYDKFNHLTGVDAKYAGHALWYYISQTYGEAVIPNILYMTRISRNIESGFLFVLGVSLKTLMQESLDYYKLSYQADEKTRQEPTGEPAPFKIKKNRKYSQFKFSPNGKMATYTTNELGKYKVYLYDMEEGKRKKVLKGGYKLNRINDYTFPLVNWHPTGKLLAIITEKKGNILLTLYDLEENKKYEKEIFKLEKVLAFDYADNGKQMVFSAISEGQTDLYLYSVAANSQQKITNDIFDDLNPKFINNSTDIIFSSNRPDDTLRTYKNDPEIETYMHDLFMTPVENRTNVIKRVTETPYVHETKPEPYSGKYFSFLSDENGIINRHIGYFDSVISHIDTAFHYRYITRTEKITDYNRNILEHEVNTKAGKVSEVIYNNGKYNLYFKDLNESPEVSSTNNTTEFIAKRKRKMEKAEAIKNIATKTDSITIKEDGKEKQTKYTTVKVFEQNDTDTLPKKKPDFIDINNYSFNKEKEGKEEVKEEKKSSKFITLTKEGETLVQEEFVLPNAKDYTLAFAATDIQSKFGFDFENQLYQRFNGGPYFNAGMGITIKVGMKDLFEDHQIDGGVRFSFNSNSTEYFLSYENRKKRLDKQYVFQRQQLSGVNNFTIFDIYTHQGKYILKYPFNEVTALRTTFNFRNDRVVTKSTDVISLLNQDQFVNWAGIKLEYVFDNTLPLGINLYDGTRYKFFGEYYKQIGQDKSDIYILGMDIRHYQKISRTFIWANRIAASTSFGNRKLVYYMGGVDDWIRLTAAPRWNNEVPVATDQGYFFQTLATPVRGFLQNIRNGNNMAVINSELRFPMFKYLMNRPIKSDFIENFQVVGFGDMGTAWDGPSPYSEDNTFNTKVITDGPLTITLNNKKEPIVGGFGLGVRSRLWGYWVRIDHAWGVEDGLVRSPMTYLSLGLDF